MDLSALTLRLSLVLRPIKDIIGYTDVELVFTYPVSFNLLFVALSPLGTAKYVDSGIVSAEVGYALEGIFLPEVCPHSRPVLLKGPWSLRGSRGYAPHGFMGLMAGSAA